MTKAINLLLISAALFLSACAASSRWSYVPPEGDQGQSCIRECQRSFDQCIIQAQTVYDECLKEQKFERRLYENCDAGMAGTLPNNRGGCTPPSDCPPPKIRECRTTYNECYQSCGGQVTRN